MSYGVNKTRRPHQNETKPNELKKNSSPSSTNSQTPRPENIFEDRISKYKKLDLLGQGTFAKVFKARDKATKKLVAVKELLMDRETDGFPITAVREVKILKFLKNENLLKLLEVETSIPKAKFWLIFEYVEHDLLGLLRSKIPLDKSAVKHLMRQLVLGMVYLHKNQVIHRDLKSLLKIFVDLFVASNLLITKEGNLKIADFGLARFFRKDNKKGYTNRVVTIWYRAPELLLGEREYNVSIDMWSVGCILAELLFDGKALFPGEDETEQLNLIFKTCGTPTKDMWGDAKFLPNWQTMKPKQPCPRILEKKFKDRCSDKALDLLSRLLELDPKKRITAQDCLLHEWFLEDVNLPKPPRHLPRYENCNELSTKNGRIKPFQNKRKYNSVNQPNKRRKHSNPRNYYPDNRRPPPRGPPPMSDRNYRNGDFRGGRRNQFSAGRGPRERRPPINDNRGSRSVPYNKNRYHGNRHDHERKFPTSGIYNQKRR